MDKKELLHILFRMFDIDGSGQVGRAEFAKLASSIADLGALFPGNYGDFLRRFDTDWSGDVDFEEFCEVDKAYPMLFYPVVAERRPRRASRHSHRLSSTRYSSS